MNKKYCRKDALSGTTNGHGQWKIVITGLKIIEQKTKISTNVLLGDVDMRREGGGVNWG